MAVKRLTNTATHVPLFASLNLIYRHAVWHLRRVIG